MPALLEPLSAGLGGMSGSGAAGSAGGSSSAPILRAKLLEIVRIMYQHYPRPKEFIIKYRIQVGQLQLPVGVFFSLLAVFCAAGLQASHNTLASSSACTVRSSP